MCHYRLLEFSAYKWQDQTIGSPEDDGDVLDANAQSAAGADGHMPKIRKPYTITKQRERWTEEEHEKFLEALKLYGRAWRKIEEHVGTKTAVQIRSHAQKFFSKVVRESGSGSTGSAKPIEIPPPRAKRKPMHPYPRKLVLPSRKEVPSQEKLARSTSLSSSDVEQANQSPTSVLSVVASDTLGSADSNTQNGSTSPLSSATAVNRDVSSRVEYDLLQEENSSKPDDLVSVKLELFPKMEELGKEDVAEVTSLRTLKLFGKVVEVSDPGSPSNSLFFDGGENLQQLPSPAVDDTSEPCETRWNQQPYGMIPTVYLMNCSTNGLEVGCAGAVPCWSFYGTVPVPSVSINSPDIKKNEFLGESLGNGNKEGSLTCSDTGSVNALENGDGKMNNAETRSHQCPLSMYEEWKGFRPFLRSKDTEEKSSIEKPLRGFVPYKRCQPDRDTQSSTISMEERKGQRTKLCL